MRYIVEKNYVIVLGRGWYNQLMTYQYDLKNKDILAIGEFRRGNVENWLHSNAGDFSQIIDFYATIGDKEIHWKDKANRDMLHALEMENYQDEKLNFLGEKLF